MFNRTIKAMLLMGVAGSGLTVSSTVFAQDAAATEGNGSDIIVTARRVEERLQDVPISISVFTPEQISNRNITNSVDLAAYTPSLSTNTRYGPEKAAFSIRGFTQENQTSPSVGVYFADVIAPRSQGNTTSGNGAGVGSLFDLQNIQVLKGPQGTLFGRNTTGGAILLVPKKPTDNLEGYVEGTYGNHDQKRVQAVLNIPVMDTLRIRLGVDRNKRQGWLDNQSPLGARHYNDVNYTALRFSAVADLTPDLENYLVVSYGESDTNGALGQIRECDRTGLRNYQVAACAESDRERASFGAYDVYSNIDNPKQRFRQWQAINTTTWKASDTLTIKNIASYSEFREGGNFDHSGNAFSIGSTPYSFVNIRSGPRAKHGDSVAQSSFTEELQFQGQSSDGRLNWQAGGYAEISDPIGTQEVYSSIFNNCSDLYNFVCKPLLLPISATASAVVGQVSVSHNTYNFRNYGVYAQGTYKFTDQLSLTGGIRYTWDRTKATGENVYVGFANNAGTFTPFFRCNTDRRIVLSGINDSRKCFATFNANSDKPTWMIDAEYKPTNDMMLYAKYSRGYRQGSVNPSVLGFETWQPEKVDTYEVGAKTSFRGAVSGNFNVTGFYNNFSNMQLQYNLTAQPGQAAGGNAIVNVGKARIWGVEVDTSINVFQGFRVDAGYAYLNTKLQEAPTVTLSPEQMVIYATITPSAITGDALALSPKNKLTVTGTYTLPLDESVGKISFAATFSHTDKQFYSHGDDRFVKGIGTTSAALLSYNPGLLPPTNLLNVNVNWNDVLGAPVDLSFFMTNVTKKKYWTAISNSLGSTGVETFYLGEPRMFGGRLRWKFGQ